MSDDDKQELADMVRTAVKDGIVEGLGELQRRAVTELEGRINHVADQKAKANQPRILSANGK